MCKFIQTTEELNQLCLRLAEHEFVTVDTEFIREKTYWPQLCLIQIASVDEAACIDPLAPEISLQALFELMQNKNVVKVFHAARQDIWTPKRLSPSSTRSWPPWSAGSANPSVIKIWCKNCWAWNWINPCALRTGRDGL